MTSVPVVEDGDGQGRQDRLEVGRGVPEGDDALAGRGLPDLDAAVGPRGDRGRSPPRSNATPWMAPAWPSRARTSLPEARSKRRADLSAEPVRSVSPLGPTARARIGPEGPARSRTTLPSASQSRATPPCPPATTPRPSGVAATASSGPPGPWRTSGSAAGGASGAGKTSGIAQRRTVPSAEAEARRLAVRRQEGDAVDRPGVALPARPAACPSATFQRRTIAVIPAAGRDPGVGRGGQGQHAGRLGDRCGSPSPRRRPRGGSCGRRRRTGTPCGRAGRRRRLDLVAVAREGLPRGRRSGGSRGSRT